MSVCRRLEDVFIKPACKSPESGPSATLSIKVGKLMTEELDDDSRESRGIWTSAEP